MSIDPTRLSLAQAGALLRTGELTALALTDAYLERIARVDPLLNCFITVTAEQARATARARDDELRDGIDRGPLHGLPLALKDLYQTAGVRTTGGTRFLADWVPTQNAMVVDRLFAAGMVLLGKLNMHEWALGITNENPHYGDVANPWDRQRVAGGSSGGSAAALAAAMCPASLGSDTGGSIRLPAALCGVVGLKPTFGRVSVRGVLPLSWNLDHAGPMARSVADVALLLDAIAGHDAADPWSARQPCTATGASLGAGVAGLRLAVARDAHCRDAEPPVMAAFEEAVGTLRALGATIVEVELRDAGAARAANALMITTDAAALHHERLRDAPERFGADVLTRMQGGAATSGPAYAAARCTQQRWRHQLDTLFEQVDLLLTPTMPVVAPLRDGASMVAIAPRMTHFTAPFNLAGVPALSLPMGLVAGLPVALQIVGPAWGEALVLRAGAAYEQAAGWQMLEPPLAV
jgi:aspartyl-tRNA(Asn)/glutamyl-tRNA(Gln) amidotransferase subunit A